MYGHVSLKVSMNVKVVTVIWLSIAFFFCTAISKVSTPNLNVFAQLKSGNLTSTTTLQHILVKSNTRWAGSIIDSSYNYTIMGSYGDAKFSIDCNYGPGPFSAVFDKKAVFGNLTISLVKNGTVLDTQTTTDSFGGVQISGNCE